MPLDLTPKQVSDIWAYAQSLRDKQVRRQEYYDGDQDILDETGSRIDGQAKNKLVTNWIRYIVDMHTGFALSNPINYSAKRTDDDEGVQRTKNALKEFMRIYENNSLSAKDHQHLMTCILKGFSIEVHSFEGDQPGQGDIVIESYDPVNWALIYKSDGILSSAIYKAVLDQYTVIDDRLSEDQVTLWTLYDDSSIRVWKERATKPTANSSNANEAPVTITFEEVSDIPHSYGKPPVVVFATDARRVPFITDALITQQNAYNRVRSRNVDDIDYNTESLLHISGYEPGAMHQKDSSGKTPAQKLKEDKILVTKEGGRAEFLTRGNDKESVVSTLKETRDDIHMMGRIADIFQIVGATGSTSGIALKLKLKPMIEQANSFMKYFKQSLRERVDLINQINSKTRSTFVIENYDIVVNLNIPVNSTEIWQNIGNLDHLLSKVDQLEQIPEIEDPDQAYQAKLAEDEENRKRMAEEMRTAPMLFGNRDEDDENEENEEDEDESNERRDNLPRSR